MNILLKVILSTIVEATNIQRFGLIQPNGLYLHNITSEGRVIVNNDEYESAKIYKYQENNLQPDAITFIETANKTYYHLPKDIGMDILAMNEEIAPSKVAKDTLPFVMNFMTIDEFNNVVQYCKKIEEPVNLKNAYQPGLTLISFNKVFSHYISKSCLAKYQAASIDNGYTSLYKLPFDTRNGVSQTQFDALLSYCRSEHIPLYVSKVTQLEHAHPITVEGKQSTIHNDCIQKYKNLPTAVNELSKLDRYYFYEMTSYEYKRLTKWCESKDKSWILSTSDDKKIILDGKASTINKDCYEAHIKETKKNRFPITGLKALNKVEKDNLFYKDIIGAWCNDFDVPMEDYETSIDFTNTQCAHYYKTSTHNWISSDKVDQETYNDIIDTCEVLNLNLPNESTKQINVFVNNAPNEKSSESSYEPQPIKNSCYNAMFSYKYGQHFNTDASVTPKGKIILSPEYLKVITIAQQVGPRRVLFPLLASLTPEVASKAICAYLENCTPGF